MRRAIGEILQRAERIEYVGAELFLVKNDEEMDRLRELVGQAEVLKDSSRGEPAWIPKIINKQKAYKYTLYTRKTPRTITDPEKVFAALGKEFEVWKNASGKRIEEEIKEGGYTQVKADKIRREWAAKVEEERGRLNKVIADFDKMEVFITTYESAKEYPAIYYTARDTGKQLVGHLSITVPSILWYERDVVRGSERGDADVSKRIAASQKIGSTIYFKKR